MDQGQQPRVQRHGHDDLAGEHIMGDAGQLVLACLFAAIWIADTFFLRRTTFLGSSVPLGFRIALAVIVFALAGYLAKTGMAIVFGENRTGDAVVRDGVFRLVRHPIYLGELLLYAGLLTLSLSLAAAAVWLIAICFLHYLSRYEERLLLARFGEAYRQYMREVPMWLPRLWR